MDYFYLVPSLTRDAALDALQPYLERYDIHSRGRFGAWQNETGNIDHSVMQGIELVNRRLLDEAETTWIPPRSLKATAINLS